MPRDEVSANLLQQVSLLVFRGYVVFNSSNPERSFSTFEQSLVDYLTGPFLQRGRRTLKEKSELCWRTDNV